MFHLGLFALLLFAKPHVDFYAERLTGFGWASMPRWAFIVSAEVAFAGLMMLWLVRVLNPVTRLLSIEPYYIHWRVGDSPVNDTTATFTVNGVTASEQLGFYEPLNTTNEFGVKVGFRFGRKS